MERNGPDSEGAAAPRLLGLGVIATNVRSLSSSARWLARGLMALGFSALLTAFVLKVTPEFRVGVILFGAALIELGGLLAVRTRGRVSGLGRTSPGHSFAVAGLIAAGYIALTVIGNPLVRANIGVFSPVKVVAVFAALVAGFFEETLFRGTVMDRLAHAGQSPPVQVLLSGLMFGCLHFYIFAGFQAALMAQAATTVLGWALGALYLVSGRGLWPCVVAHVLIDAVLEPALLLGFLH